MIIVLCLHNTRQRRTVLGSVHGFPMACDAIDCETGITYAKRMLLEVKVTTGNSLAGNRGATATLQKQIEPSTDTKAHS